MDLPQASCRRQDTKCRIDCRSTRPKSLVLCRKRINLCVKGSRVMGTVGRTRKVNVDDTACAGVITIEQVCWEVVREGRYVIRGVYKG